MGLFVTMRSAAAFSRRPAAFSRRWERVPALSIAIASSAFTSRAAPRAAASPACASNGFSTSDRNAA